MQHGSARFAASMVGLRSPGREGQVADSCRWCTAPVTGVMMLFCMSHPPRRECDVRLELRVYVLVSKLRSRKVIWGWLERGSKKYQVIQRRNHRLCRVILNVSFERVDAEDCQERFLIEFGFVLASRARTPYFRATGRTPYWYDHRNPHAMPDGLSLAAGIAQVSRMGPRARVDDRVRARRGWGRRVGLTDPRPRGLTVDYGPWI